MALLSERDRAAYFDALGLKYDEEGIRTIQSRYLRPKDVDGIYGTDTDNLLRHLVYVKLFCKNFEPEEFKCECGGRYCTGYPTYMKPNELMHIQAIRDHYARPITITCGLRCKPYNNSLKGSIPNSRHLSGQAVDFYQQGVTDTLGNRKASIKYIKGLPNHNYTYGNGINSAGYGVSAPYMGNALHTDTNGDGSERIILATEEKPTEQVLPSYTNRELVAFFANYFAYKKNTEKANVNGGKPRPSYKTALDTVFPPKTRKSWSKGPRIGASCDVFVATVLRFSGVDKKCPRGVDAAYLAKSAKYKEVKVTAKTIKDGDIICCDGHICIHYGGKIKEAASGGKALNYQGRFYPKTTNTLSSRLKGARVFRVK